MSSTRPWLLPALALACSLVALGVSLTGPRPAPAGSGDHSPEIRAELEKLNARLDRLAAGGSTALPAASPVATAAAATVAASPAEERRRLATAATVDDMRWIMTQRGLMPPTPEHLQRARALIFDDAAPLADRLTSLRILRTGEALSDDVVRKMVDVYRGSDDQRTQFEIIRRLDDVRTPEFADVLLEASATSDNARLRRAAIDSLSGYLPDPDLKLWLETVAQADANRSVRDEATRLLRRHWPQPAGTP